MQIYYIKVQEKPRRVRNERRKRRTVRERQEDVT